MMEHNLTRCVAAAVFAGLAAAGCAGWAPSLEVGAFANSRPVAGSSADIYTRVARGALACWFGANGALKNGYFYHSEAEPPSRGGASRIVVRVKEGMGPSVKGVRAFSVAIRPNGESAEIEVVNHKLSETLGAELKGDVDRWTAGEVGCRDISRGADWTPQDPDEAGAASPGTSKKAKKPPGRKI